MTWLDWWMVTVVGVAAFVVLGSAPRLQPVAETPTPFAELPERVDAIEHRLDLIEQLLLERLDPPVAAPD